jgi:hypothetical protein
VLRRKLQERLAFKLGVLRPSEQNGLQDRLCTSPGKRRILVLHFCLSCSMSASRCPLSSGRVAGTYNMSIKIIPIIPRAEAAKAQETVDISKSIGDRRSSEHPAQLGLY